MAMTRVELVNVSKKFGDFVAVNNVSLSVNPGEFLVLLGPSGSGKTTLLRMIAGLIRETSGDILINGRNVKGIPPYKRNIGFVFQDRALFSHMSVIENVAFGLRMRGSPKSERYKRARELLEMVHLTHYENRSPRLLSGGEQQRVALTRALALNPVLLLLDEPLSSLDRKLRIEM
ncbi:ABC transporter ATP-binding protein, partial [Candidatus Aerophobetes bacterium]